MPYFSRAAEAVDDVLPDEGRVVDEFVDEGNVAIVTASPDQTRATAHVAQHSLDDSARKAPANGLRKKENVIKLLIENKLQKREYM